VARSGVVIAVSYRTLLERRPIRWLLLGGATNYAAPTGLLVVAVWAAAVAYPSDTSNKFAPLALAYFGLSSTIPTVVTAVFSGVIADRFDRRRLMLFTNLLATVATIGAVGVFAWGNTTPISAPGVPGFYFPAYLLALLPLWAIVWVSLTLFRPAFNSSIPRLCEPSELGSANGLVYGIAIAVLVPLSLGSTALVGVVGFALALIPSVGLLVVAQLTLAQVPGGLNPERSGERPRFFADAKMGYLYLWRRKALLYLTFGGLAAGFFIAVAFVELGVYVTVWLRYDDPIIYGGLTASSYVGIAAGALLAPRLRFEPRSGALIIVFIAGLGLSTSALGLLQTAWVAFLAIFLFGMFQGLITPIYLAVVQATVPGELVGRVLAADEVGSLSMTPVGQYVGGLITVAAGVQYAYIISGIGSLLVAVGLAASRELRKFGFEPGQPVVYPPTAVSEAGVVTTGQL
jgi:MFS family permease